MQLFWSAMHLFLNHTLYVTFRNLLVVASSYRCRSKVRIVGVEKLSVSTRHIKLLPPTGGIEWSWYANIHSFFLYDCNILSLPLFLAEHITSQNKDDIYQLPLQLGR